MGLNCRTRVALQALDSICGDAGSVNSDCYNTQARQVEVTRTGDGTKTSNYGYTFSISFVGTFVSGALHRLPSQTQDTQNKIAAPVPAPFTVTGGLNAAVVTDVVNVGKALGTDTEIQTIIAAADKPVTVGVDTRSNSLTVAQLQQLVASHGMLLLWK